MKTIQTSNKQFASKRTPSKLTQLLLVTSSLVFASNISWAEISSLSPEELTDTYIKDTTVIVRQPEQQPKTTIPVKLKVTPLEQAAQVLPENNTATQSTISNDINTYNEINNLNALNNNLQPQIPATTSEFLKAPVSLPLLKQIQDLYGLDSVPTDLSSLGFNENMANDIAIQNRLPSNTAFAADDKTLQFTIPNLGNFNTQQIQSPNGEISVNVNPSQIQYIINLPK